MKTLNCGTSKKISSLESNFPILDVALWIYKVYKITEMHVQHYIDNEANKANRHRKKNYTI